MIRLVLFDIDGTLINSGGAGEKAFARVFAHIFDVHSGSEKLKFAGRTDPAIVRDFFRLNSIEPNPENFAKFFDNYVFWLDHMLPQLRGSVLQGVPELIRDLNALPEPPCVGLLTGNVRLGAQLKLSHYQLWHHFRTGAFADDHEDRCQIAVVARQRGCQLLGRSLRGEEILVIGDTPFDIACGKHIDAKVLAVATGRYSTAELKEHGPTWAVDHLAQMPAHALIH